MKKLTLTHGITAVITTLLGSGIFIVPAITAAQSGSGSLIGWLLMCVAIIPVAYTFGLLGRMFPHAGGSAFFVEQAFGKRFGSLMASLYLSIIPIGPPVVIITGANYLASLFHLSTSVTLFFSILSLAIIYLLNQYNYRLSANVGVVITTLIIAIVTSLFTASLWQEHSLSPPVFDDGLAASLGVVFWCFVGIEAMTHLSAEFENKKDFLPAVVIGVVIVALAYSAVSYSVLKFNAFGEESRNIQSLLIITSKVVPYYGREVLSIVGFLICLIAANLYVASSARLLHSGTKKYLNFNKSIQIIVGVIAATVSLKLIYAFDIEWLILYANGVFVMIYFGVMLSGFFLLKGGQKFMAAISVLFMFAVIVALGSMMLYSLLFLGAFLIVQQINRLRSNQCEQSH